MITYPGISPAVPALLVVASIVIGICLVWCIRIYRTDTEKDSIGPTMVAICILAFLICLTQVYSSILDTAPTYYPSESKTCYVVLDKDGNPAFEVFGVNDESPSLFESIQVDLKKCFPKD